MRFVKKLEKVILAESVLCILTLTLIFVGWHFDAVVFFILIIQIMILIYTVITNKSIKLIAVDINISIPY